MLAKKQTSKGEIGLVGPSLICKTPGMKSNVQEGLIDSPCKAEPVELVPRCPALFLEPFSKLEVLFGGVARSPGIRSPFACGKHVCQQQSLKLACLTNRQAPKIHFMSLGTAFCWFPSKHF
uniref:Uncharacterized protein n=1 Tax=Sphaerodactylus townsendi TaxID=933632 RepID=A0ACB8FDW3_9SAUR